MSRISIKTNDSILKADRFPKIKPIPNDILFEILLHTYILFVKLKSFRTSIQTIVHNIKVLSRVKKKEIYLESLQLNEYRILVFFSID